MQIKSKEVNHALSNFFLYTVMINSSLLLGKAIITLLHPQIATSVWLALIFLYPWSVWLYLLYDKNIVLSQLSGLKKLYWISMPIVSMIVFCAGGLV